MGEVCVVYRVCVMGRVDGCMGEVREVAACVCMG